MAQLMFPNIAGTAMQAFQQGQEARANRLIGLAMQNPNQSQQYLGQAATINPGAVMQVQGAQARNQYMQSMQQRMAQQTQQAQQEQMAKKAGAAARYWKAAMQTGNPQAKATAAQAVLPFLSQMAAAQGKPPPTAQDLESPQAVAGLDQIIAQTAYLFPDDMKLQTVTPGSVVMRGSQPVYSNPAAPKIENGYAVSQGPNGNLVAAPIPITGAGAAPQPQSAPQVGQPSQIAGAPAGTQVTEATGADGARVQFAFAPGTPDAVKAQAAQMAGVPQAPATQAQPQTLADVTGKGASQGVIAQRAQQIQALKARGVAMTPEDEQQYLLTGKASSFQGDSNATAFGDTSLSGEQYVESIPKGNQEIVRGLLNGTVALPTGTVLKSPLWQSALASVKHADPSWNQGAYNQFVSTRKYMTIGKGGALVNSINTAAQHLQKLVDDVNALDNGRFSDINAIANAFSRHTGGQAITDFSGDLTPVASELAAVYKNGGTPTDQETQHWREALSPNMSRAQQLNVIRGWIDLLAGKLNATRNQYQASMSPLSEPLSVINPKAAQALERITDLANKVSTTGQHAMPQEGTAPIYAPGQKAPQSSAQSDPALDALLKKYGGG